MNQKTRLAEGVAEMGLEISPEAQEKLLAYLALLEKWSKVYNLTAISDADDMVTLHLLDSLSVLPYIQSGSLLDVGSGAGLPGIVLAIVRPDLQVTTIDTVQKKAIFMRQVKAELRLGNLEVMNARVEEYKPTHKFEMIISRAFSELSLFVKLTRHLLVEKGTWFAMKGRLLPKEMEELSVKIIRTIPLKVAGLNAERHLIMLEQNQ